MGIKSLRIKIEADIEKRDGEKHPLKRLGGKEVENPAPLGRQPRSGWTGMANVMQELPFTRNAANNVCPSVL